MAEKDLGELVDSRLSQQCAQVANTPMASWPASGIVWPTGPREVMILLIAALVRSQVDIVFCFGSQVATGEV